MSTPTVELGDPARSLAAFEYWLRATAAPGVPARSPRSSCRCCSWAPSASLGSLVDAEGQGIGGVPYLEFVAPGILAASAMQSAFSESTWPILSSKKMNGHYFAQAGSPLTVPDIVSGQLLFILFRLSLGAVAFTVVGACSVPSHRPGSRSPCRSRCSPAWPT